MSGSPFFGKPRPVLVPTPAPPFPLARASLVLRSYGVEISEIFSSSATALAVSARFSVWAILADELWTPIEIARAFGRNADAVHAKLVERGVL
jgi:hypothetical protein